MKRSERTCCVCRSIGSKRFLARLVFVEGKLRWDSRQKLPGRGGYVHQEARCVSKMGQPGRWERVLKLSPGTLKVAEVAQVAQQLLAEVCLRDVGVTAGDIEEVNKASRKGGQ